MPILQDSKPPLHRNFVSAPTVQSPIPCVEPAAFAPAVSPRRRRNGPATMAEPIAMGPSPSGWTLPSRLQRLAIVVVMRERMIGQAKLIGHEHVGTCDHYSPS